MKEFIYSLGRKSYKLWSKLLDIIGDIKVYKWPFFMVYDPSFFQMTGERIQEALDVLQPGDVVLRGYDCYLDGHFIDGDYSHGSVCTGAHEITHAISPKVCTVHPIEFMECDRIMILRPKDQSLVEKAIRLAKEKIGTPYDFGFNSGDDGEMYCFELAAKSYPDLKIQTYELKKLFGLFKKDVYLGKSFFLNDGFEIVFEYNPRKGFSTPLGFRAPSSAPCV